MKYLIIGASGFIGGAIYKYCKKLNLEVYGTYRSCYESDNLLRFDQIYESLNDLIRKYKIEDFNDFAVIMCAANTSIDSCKEDEYSSRLLNVISTKKVVNEILELGGKPVFLSSEAVFDGKRGLYSELDTPCPITVYGNQKLEVENYILNSTDECLIFRISRAVSSVRGDGDIFDDFRDKILRGEPITCIENQSFNPTEVGDIAKCVILACERRLNGIYHIANRTYISRAELARFYSAEVLHKKAYIVEKGIGEMHFLDNRHIYGGLNAEKIENVLNFRFKELQDIL